MIPQTKSTIRYATDKDIEKLDSLIRSRQIVHKHLDWRGPLNRISEAPFLIIQRENRIIGALSCPPDPPTTAWIQLFLSTGEDSTKVIWETLLKEAITSLQGTSAKQIMSIPIFPWFSNLILESGFEEVSRVIVMNLNIKDRSKKIICPSIEIRNMEKSDLKDLEILDRESFNPIWHNTLKSLEEAFRQSYLASVAIEENKIIGYQISTISRSSIHLARLAVNPENQTKGIGSALLSNLIDQIRSKNREILSVNTQQNNIYSINLYKKFGFQETDEFFQVFAYKIPNLN
ncbi:MAG: GNAT family N-acetyltransferase [Candidatus Heimdallarchaeota archaeon]|nr:GNAT family N-acetyltransferase [Candidatus Heimdallarchaeota archaeon]